RLAAVCPPGIELERVTIVQLSGHPRLAQARPDVGLGKLIDAVEIVIRPAADGMAHDAARLSRIASAFLARTDAKVARGDRTIDVRALVLDAGVLDAEAAAKVCAALDWPAGPLLRVRVRATAEGSAKPS